ncbi:SDR family oxidoreductase [Ciceribacter sp. L1K22]|uniref:SDR family oxidoreductase n=1 Tax=Ciceribacter sp. L1K22 TaxID=2820275 RepID=UPI001ABDF1FB|nr:SDR family oxidoreductase [Ciceribacter sp. L1K22]MBO3760764.1 SDR family oxidoreductase [Ciceribacter sp. L1K22]
MSKILITGASGKLGRLVIDNLLASGKVSASDLVAGTRDTAKLADLSGKGVEIRRVDFDDEAGLIEAFAGIGRLLIISTDVLDRPGHRLVQHQAAVRAAKAAGVGRVYYTSIPNAETSKVSFAPDHAGTEEAIKASGMAYTILRNGWYMQNLFMGLPSAFASGHWYTSAGDGKTSHIAREDIARATAAALANPPSENVIYTLTGARAYSNSEIAALASAATGKPLAVVNITDEQLAEGMAAHGVPAPFIPTLVSFEAATRAGDLGSVTSDAEKLVGAPLVTLETFIETNSASLAG